MDFCEGRSAATTDQLCLHDKDTGTNRHQCTQRVAVVVDHTSSLLTMLGPIKGMSNNTQPLGARRTIALLSKHVNKEQQHCLLAKNALGSDLQPGRPTQAVLDSNMNMYEVPYGTRMLLGKHCRQLGRHTLETSW